MIFLGVLRWWEPVFFVENIFPCDHFFLHNRNEDEYNFNYGNENENIVIVKLRWCELPFFVHYGDEKENIGVLW